MPLGTPTLVQSGFVNVVALTGNAALATPVTLGNTIVVAAITGVTSGASLATATVSDNLGNTYTRIATANASTSGVALYVAPVTVAGSCTVSLSGAVTGTGLTIVPMEWSNLASSTPVLTYKLASTTATTVTPVNRWLEQNALVIQVADTGDSGGSLANAMTSIHSSTTVGTGGHIVERLIANAEGNWNIPCAVNGNGTNLTQVFAVWNPVDTRPTIVSGPSQQTVATGSTATFSVTAQSNGGTGLTYQWYKNGVSISGATASSYTTPATTSADENAYFHVVVTDSAGSVVSWSVDLVLSDVSAVADGKYDATNAMLRRNRRNELAPLAKFINFGVVDNVQATIFGNYFWEQSGPTPDATATGALPTVTLSAPTGSAAGTSVINASATGTLPSVSLSAPAGSAYAGSPPLIVGTSQTTSATGGNLSFTRTLTAGSSLILIFSENSGSGTGNGLPSISGGGTWSQVAASTYIAFHTRVSVWRLDGVSAGSTTITITPSISTDYTSAILTEWTALAAVDQTSTGGGAGSFGVAPNVGPSGATTANDEIVIAAFGDDGTAAGASTPSGYTSLGTVGAALGGTSAAYKTTSTTGTQSATWGSLTTGDQWTSVLVTFAAGAAATNATGTGTLAALTLSAPAGTASGTTVVNATGTGALTTITLSAPTGTASAGTVVDGSATGTVPALTLSTPTGAATGSASATGAIAAVTLSTPAATATGTTVINASATGTITAVTLSTPTGTAFAGTVVDGNATGTITALTLSTPAGSSSGSGVATGTVTALTLSAPSASASGTTVINASATGTITAVTLSAPAGVADTATHGSATGTVSALTMTAPSGTAAGTANANATGSLASILISAATGSASGSSVIDATATGTIPQIILSAPTGTASNAAGPTQTDLIYKILSNKQALDPVTGKLTIWDDDGVTILYQANAWEDTAATIPYRGKALGRIDKLV